MHAEPREHDEAEHFVKRRRQHAEAHDEHEQHGEQEIQAKPFHNEASL